MTLPDGNFKRDVDGIIDGIIDEITLIPDELLEETLKKNGEGK